MPAEPRSDTAGRQPGDVVIWRNDLLPTSETFITNQMSALTHWRPRMAGLRRVPGLLPVAPDLVLTRWERRALRRLGTVPRLHRMLRADRTRLIHAHFGPDATAVLRAARLARCPLVVTFHGYDVTQRAETIASGRYAKHWPELMAYASQLIAVSNFIAGRLVELGAPRDKIVVHYIGTPVPPAALRGPNIEPVVLFVGRLVEKKNCAGLLEAMAALPEPWRSTQVRIVGDGPLRSDLEEQALKLELRAAFLGAMTSADVAAHMREATVFCSPGRPAANGDAEGLMMTALEAAAVGLPVVVGDNGGVREVLADGVTGMMIPPNDPAALVRALLALLRDRELAARLGAAGRQRVEQHFDLRRQTVALESIYDRCARAAR